MLEPSRYRSNPVSAQSSRSRFSNATDVLADSPDGFGLRTRSITASHAEISGPAGTVDRSPPRDFSGSRSARSSILGAHFFGAPVDRQRANAGSEFGHCSGHACHERFRRPRRDAPLRRVSASSARNREHVRSLCRGDRHRASDHEMLIASRRECDSGFFLILRSRHREDLLHSVRF